MKTKYIILAIIGVIMLVGAYAEEIKNLIVPKETYDALQAQATTTGTDINTVTLEKIQKGMTAQTEEERKADIIELTELRNTCIKQNKIKECSAALKGVVN